MGCIGQSPLPVFLVVPLNGENRQETEDQEEMEKRHTPGSFLLGLLLMVGEFLPQAAVPMIGPSPKLLFSLMKFSSVPLGVSSFLVGILANA